MLHAHPSSINNLTHQAVMPKAPQPVIVTPSFNESLPDNKESLALKNWEVQLQAHSKQVGQSNCVIFSRLKTFVLP